MGFRQATWDDLKPGERVYVDDGFDCMGAGPKQVYEAKDCHGVPGLFVFCSAGRHYLAGQLRPDGSLAGVSVVDG